MIFPEVKVRQLLVSNEHLIETMNNMRPASVQDDKMVFTGKITDKYIAYKYAPMIRINYMGSSWRGSDNEHTLTIPRMLVSFWCQSLAQGQILYPIIRDTLTDGGFYIYDDGHDKDPDSQDSKGRELWMFRFFIRSLDMKEE